MKFQLRAAAHEYTREDAMKLKELGFTLKAIEPNFHEPDLVFETDHEVIPEIEISTLEELLALSEFVHTELIVDGKDPELMPSILIYNDWIE